MCSRKNLFRACVHVARPAAGIAFLFRVAFVLCIGRLRGLGFGYGWKEAGKILCYERPSVFCPIWSNDERLTRVCFAAA